jgi:hypothetical protein
MRDDAFKSHAACLNHESDNCVAAAFSVADNTATSMRGQLPHIGHSRVILATMFRRYKVATPASRRPLASP